MKSVFQFLVAALFLVTNSATAQNRIITGLVTSKEDGQALTGVTILIEGTVLGTKTDSAGRYSIAIPEGAKTIVFSHLGYISKKISLGSSTEINIGLEIDPTNLREVVITALGITREKNALGYSVQDLNYEDINHIVSSNPLNALSGKIAGATIISASGTPGAPVRVQLRGATSILGNNQPLFIIDGVPVDNSEINNANDVFGAEGILQSNRLVDINNEDIENISVLKGPSAAALYGSQAANGAIVITTKKGANKNLNVSLSFTGTKDRVSELPKLQNEYAQGFLESVLNPNSTDGLRAFSFGPKIKNLVYDGIANPWSKLGNLIDKNSYPSGSPAKAYNPYDFFENGYGFLTSLAVFGGNKDLAYRASVTHSIQNGTTPLSDFTKTNISFSTQYQFKKNFSLSTIFNFANSGGSRMQHGSNLNGVMVGLLRTPPSFDNANGVNDATDPLAFMLNDDSGLQRSYRGTGGYDNPYWTVNMNPYNDRVNRLFGNITAIINPLDWLTIVNRFGADMYTETRDQIFSKGSSGFYVDGLVFTNQYTKQIINNDLMVTANKKLGDNLNSSFMLGNNIFDSKVKALHLQGEGLNFNEFQGISNTQTNSLNIGNSKIRRVAFYGQARLDYKNFLYFDLTGRVEQSSTLPKSNNTYFYPSGSLSFLFTDAISSLQNGKVLSFGKLRASYALVGKDVEPYSLKTYYERATTYINGTPFASFPFNGLTGFTKSSSLGNDKLKVEKTKSFEIGANLYFLQNRVGIDYTYYHTKSSDLLNIVPIASSTGYNSIYMNAADMENKGHEVMLNVTPIKGQKFTWYLNFNFGLNRNKVLRLGEGLDRIDLNGFSSMLASAVVGKPYGALYGTGYVKTPEGQLVINDEGTPGDGTYGMPIIANDLQYLGDINAKWSGSISNSFTFKGFNLNFLIETRQGNKMWNGTLGILTHFGVSVSTLDRYTNKVFTGITGHIDMNTGQLVTSNEQNDISVNLNEDYYTSVGGFSVSEPYIQDGSWIRLREVSLSYKVLGNKLFKKSVFEAVTVGIAGRNLWLSTNYTGIDPETNLFGSQTAQGFDYFNNPGTKTYSFNLRFDF